MTVRILKQTDGMSGMPNSGSTWPKVYGRSNSQSISVVLIMILKGCPFTVKMGTTPETNSNLLFLGDGPIWRCTMHDGITLSRRHALIGNGMWTGREAKLRELPTGNQLLNFSMIFLILPVFTLAKLDNIIVSWHHIHVFVRVLSVLRRIMHNLLTHSSFDAHLVVWVATEIVNPVWDLWAVGCLEAHSEGDSD